MSQDYVKFVTAAHKDIKQLNYYITASSLGSGQWEPDDVQKLKVLDSPGSTHWV